jgi:NAD-dependent protein deacetylase/lipoamidase
MEFPWELIDTLCSAQYVTVLTGAGISAESGIPTFRQAQTGLWARYDPQQLATPEAFQRDPRLVWEWYTWRRGLISQAKPNPGHLSLVELENRIPNFTLITQNVDGLHRLAGSRSLIELHGDIHRNKCSVEGRVVANFIETGEDPPRCPECGALLRPDVVWFGESLPNRALQAAMAAARSSQVFFSIGTSSLVEPAASLPFIALDSGSAVVEVNPEETPLSRYATYVLPGLSGVVLPALLQLIREE